VKVHKKHKLEKALHIYRIRSVENISLFMFEKNNLRVMFDIPNLSVTSGGLLQSGGRQITSQI